METVAPIKFEVGKKYVKSFNVDGYAFDETYTVTKRSAQFVTVKGAHDEKEQRCKVKILPWDQSEEVLRLDCITCLYAKEVA